MRDIFYYLKGKQALKETDQEKALQIAGARLKKGGNKFIKSKYHQSYEAAARVISEAIEMYISEEWDEDAFSCAGMLVDNKYLIEKLLIRLDDSEKIIKSKRLARIADGEYRGIQRTLAIADSVMRCGFGLISESSIIEFIDIVQSKAPLSLHETGAVLEMIRFSLIELIGSVAKWCVDRMELSIGCDSLLARIGDSRIKAERAFTRISRSDVAGCIYMKLVEREEYALIDILGKRLKEASIDIESELKTASAVRELLSNAMISIREVDAIDAAEFVERISMINRTYLADDVYARMDDASKSYYMRCTEKIAATLKLDEVTVALRAVSLTKNRIGKASHVGYFLIEKGKDELFFELRPEKRIRGVNSKLSVCLFSAIQYAIAMLLIVLGLLEGLLAALLSVSAALYIGYFITVRLSCMIVKPRCIPRLALKDGIGSENRTLLVTPVLFTGKSSVEDSLKRIEEHYIANKLDNCFFGVLADFPDADELELSGEQELMERAILLVKALNEKYKSDESIFYFILRKRVFVESENRYMGYERKRGAIEELTRLVALGDKGTFRVIEPDIPSGIKYIATLDADTVLPHGTLKRLIGGMTHPLNKPVFGTSGIVKEGIGIIAPRMECRAKGKDSTFFSSKLSYSGGLNAYDSVVSDLAQDFFYEGNFGGKGIFSVEAYINAVCDFIPDNTVLSHDLLEGCRLRCGYMSDVILYDSEPKNFFSFWKRKHRWLRGDWQLLGFIFGKKSKGLTLLHKWKLLDNLFRSMFSVNVFLGLSFALIFNRTYPAIIFLAAALFDAIFELGRILLSYGDKRTDIKGSLYEFLQTQLISGINLTTLPYDAYMCVDAAVRSVFRLLISHKKMLEWQTAAESEHKKEESISKCYERMLPNIIAGIVLIVLGIFSTASLFCVPVGVIWLLAPLLVYRMDLPYKKQELTQSQRDELLKLSELTWQYFSDNCNESTNFLPPDNVQTQPKRPNSSLTSPTNIGMALIALLSAHDMHLISDEEFKARLDKTLTTIESMSKWNGHLYNWYDITTLKPVGNPFISTVDSGNLLASLMCLKSALDEFKEEFFNDLKNRITALIDEMDFYMLFDKRRSLLHIGYDLNAGRLTPSYYDLLASEARITVFSCIAEGKLPAKAWMKLGRVLTDAYGVRMLASWSGTAFEYLMAGIFMEAYTGTLIRASCEGALNAQRMFAKKGRPFGVSESGYFAFDKNLNYQYRAFGVPSLGMCVDERSKNMVVPYASMLCLEYDYEHVLNNLESLISSGMLGKYGLYEAADYSSGRQEIVRSFMAHHEGMTIAAINNALNDGILRKRFMRIPGASASEILLEEKRPRKSLVVRRLPSVENTRMPIKKNGERRISVSNGDVIKTQTLTNGSATAYFASDGDSFVRIGDIMLGTWRDRKGMQPYGLQILMLCDGMVISPTIGAAELGEHSACFSSSKVEFDCITDILEATREICLTHNGLIERITVINRTNVQKRVDVSAFMEVCLTRQEDAIAHPAFVRTGIDSMLLSEDNILIFRRRAKGNSREKRLFFKMDGVDVEYSSDRLAMPGRNTAYSDAMYQRLQAKDNITAPIEPGIYAHTSVDINPHARVTFTISMGMCEEEDAVKQAANDLCAHPDRSFGLAESYISGALALHGIPDPNVELFQQLISCLMRPSMKEGKFPYTFGIKRLWRYGISGDYPILTVKINVNSELKLLKIILMFNKYLECHTINADIIILADIGNGYHDELRDGILELINAYRSGMVRLLAERSMEGGDIELLKACSSVYIDLSKGIRKQLTQERVCTYKKPALPASLMKAPFELKFDNGFGGFDESTGDYVIYNRNTPLPWVNVLSNGSFGTIISEGGNGYTFSENSRELKLTSWHNDAVFDNGDETITIDRNGSIYDLLHDTVKFVRHGFGYSSFEGGIDDLNIDATIFVDEHDAVKFTLIAVTNTGANKERISIKYTAIPVIGAQPHMEAIKYEVVDDHIVFRNARNAECASRMMYITALYKSSVKIDQKKPYIHCEMLIDPGETKRLVLCMGFDDEQGIGNISGLTAYDVEKRLFAVKDMWKDRLSAIKIHTGDDAFDLLMNGRLLYQTLACRLMARSGFYQSGGAYGFRDQLQDVLAVLYTEPELVRSHILLCAKRQFIEGDVLHWWHEGMAGIRSGFADDRLFMAYATLRYIEVTKDRDILLEKVEYLEDMPRDYAEYKVSDKKETLFMHCKRAIDSVLQFGSHDLPLMQGGDWNDGMDAVGKDGGESVWLALMLIVVLEGFKEYCDEEMKNHYTDMIALLRSACEEKAWDGEWYKRAFMAGGTAIGSTYSKACKIDGLTQSWAVFAGMQHKHTAMASLKKLLLDEESGIIRLLAPPFSASDTDIGYISSYIEGVRENGGQYTHAAAWAIIAECMLNNHASADMMFSMINPINHSRDRMQVLRYKTEPFAVAADVYSIGKNAGRGGWTWYTGAASWLYQAGLMHILGVKLLGDVLEFDQNITKIPFELRYRFKTSEYYILVKEGEEPSIMCDGMPVSKLKLTDDGKEHEAIVVIKTNNEH